MTLSELNRYAKDISIMTGKKFKINISDGCIFFLEKGPDAWSRYLFTVWNDDNGRDKMLIFLRGFKMGVYESGAADEQILRI